MAGVPGLHDVPQPTLLQQLAVGHHAPQDRSHTYAAAPLSRNITAYMRVTDALIRSPGSSSQRFCSATSFTGLVYSVQAFTPESSTERMTDV